MWSTGYFVSSVGLDEETIKNYVEHQGQTGFRATSSEVVIRSVATGESHRTTGFTRGYLLYLVIVYTATHSLNNF